MGNQAVELYSLVDASESLVDRLVVEEWGEEDVGESIPGWFSDSLVDLLVLVELGDERAGDRLPGWFLNQRGASNLNHP